MNPENVIQGLMNHIKWKGVILLVYSANVTLKSIKNQEKSM